MVPNTKRLLHQQQSHTSTFPKHILSEHGGPVGAAGDDGLHTQVLRPAGHPVVLIIDALAAQGEKRVKGEFEPWATRPV